MNKLINSGSHTINELHILANEVNLKVKIYDYLKLPIRIPDGNYIIMIHPPHENGHYTCFKKEGKNLYYFDNFGQPPPSKIKNFGNTYWNDKQITTINMNHCGIFCIDFLKHLEHKKGVKANILAMDGFINKFYHYNSY